MTDAAPRGNAPDARHRRGEPGFRRASIAMFAAGVSTFVLLYAPQPLLPLLSHDLRVSPAGASLTLAVPTATLALALLPAGWLSDAYGRTRVMSFSLLAASVLGLLCAAAPGYGALLVLRALQGAALAGMPAVGMAYLAEEIHPASLGSSIGLYIGGNALGGMTGRLLAGVLGEHGDWRAALAGVGLLSLACATLFWRLAPPSRHHVPARFALRRALTSLTVNLRPWARVRITSRDTSGAVPAEPQLTPFMVSLLPGEYTLIAENDGITPRTEFSVTVEPGKVTLVSRDMPGFSPDRTVDALLGTNR